MDIDQGDEERSHSTERDALETRKSWETFAVVIMRQWYSRS